jgi:hypothetical protein
MKRIGTLVGLTVTLLRVLIWRLRLRLGAFGSPEYWSTQLQKLQEKGMWSVDDWTSKTRPGVSRVHRHR